MSKASEAVDFFISFNKSDRAAAEWILWVTKHEGKFSTLSQIEDFGTQFVGDMNEGLKRCGHCLAVVSDDYFASNFFTLEWQNFIAKNRTSIVPVRVRTLAPHNETNLFGATAYADLSDCDEEAAAERLLDLLRRAKGQKTPLRKKPAFFKSPAKPAFPDLKTTLATTNLRHANPGFVGRHAELRRIAAALSRDADQARVICHAITGLGGIGKTQLALAFAHSRITSDRIVWWLDAEQPATLAAEFATLAPRIGGTQPTDLDEARRQVLDKLRTSGGWLLIFDNAEDPEAIRPFIPATGDGRVLLTSRRSQWPSLARSIPLDVLDPADALTLLTGNEQAERDHAPGESAAARRICEELGFLPLALAQARAIILPSGRTFASYLALIENRILDIMQRGADDLALAGEMGTGQEAKARQRAVTATWEISIETAQARHAGSRPLLELLSFFAPEPLPRAVLDAAPDALPEPLRDEFDRDEAIAALAACSLIGTADGSITTHRLVQAITRARLEKEEPEAARDRAETSSSLCRASLPAHPPDDHRSWPVYQPLLPHLLEVTKHAERLGAGLETAATLLNETGLFLKSRAAYKDAEPLYQRDIAITEKTLGPDHPNLAKSLNNLALLYSTTGRYEDAEPLFKRAIAIGEKTLGPDHPNLATRLNNLANLYSDTGRYEDAEPLYERAMAITEKALGPDHPDLATSLNNLANLYRTTGRYEDAEPLVKRAIAIGEKTLGPDHPDLATWLNNLANLYRATGRYKDAEPLFKRAIDIGEKALGPDHPNLATSLNNLAKLYWQMERHDEALPLYERALSIFRKALPPDHPNLARVMENFADALESAKEVKEAKSLRAEAQAIRDARETKATQPSQETNLR